MDEKSNRIPMIVAGLAIVVALTLWIFRETLSPVESPVIQTPPATESLPVAEESATSGPISRPAHELQPVGPAGEAVTEEPLPVLEDSDEAILAALTETFGPAVEPLLVDSQLINKIVATVDSLSGSHLAEKVRPVIQLPDGFKVVPLENGEQFHLSPDNYRRYDSLVALAISADPAAVGAMYRRYYPLFQESYTRLGYPYRYFNDQVVGLIDLLLATPRPEEPVVLVQPHVLYKFADPELEALSSGQKFLIRMGDANAEALKQYLRRLRTQIARPQ